MKNLWEFLIKKLPFSHFHKLIEEVGQKNLNWAKVEVQTINGTVHISIPTLEDNYLELGVQCMIET